MRWLYLVYFILIIVNNFSFNSIHLFIIIICENIYNPGNGKDNILILELRTLLNVAVYDLHSLNFIEAWELTIILIVHIHILLLPAFYLFSVSLPFATVIFRHLNTEALLYWHSNIEWNYYHRKITRCIFSFPSLCYIIYKYILMVISDNDGKNRKLCSLIEFLYLCLYIYTVIVIW